MTVAEFRAEVAIRSGAIGRTIKQWEIARAAGIQEQALSRMLRVPSDEIVDSLLVALDEIAPPREQVA